MFLDIFACFYHLHTLLLHYTSDNFCTLTTTITSTDYTLLLLLLLAADELLACSLHGLLAEGGGQLLQNAQDVRGRHFGLGTWLLGKAWNQLLAA